MRAGSLDRTITIERVTSTTLTAAGSPVDTWAPIATLRAQVIEAATDESIRQHGAATERVVVFRTRYLAGVTPADRVAFEGQHYDIKQLKEIGRRRGLEIRAERLGP